MRSDRRARRPTRRWSRWAVVVSGLAVMGGVAGWVTNSTLFDLRSVRVSGNRHLSAQEVVELASLDEGSNVLWLSTGEVESRLEDDPWILRADVSRALPSTVTISIVERSPVAVTGGATAELVAADGAVLGPAPAGARLPALATVAGPGLATSPELAVAGTLQRRLRPLVASIGRDDGGGLVLTLRDGVHVAYGDGTRPDQKATALRAVLGWAARNGVQPQYIDVSAPSAPALLPPGVPIPSLPVRPDHSRQ